LTTATETLIMSHLYAQSSVSDQHPLVIVLA
jgi:hypothetical protein